MALDLAAQLALDNASLLPTDGSGFAVDAVGPGGTVRVVYTERAWNGEQVAPLIWTTDANVTAAGIGTGGVSVTVDGNAHTVAGVRPSGFGWTEILLT